VLVIHAFRIVSAFFHTARQLAGQIARVRGDGYDQRRAQVAIAAALVHDVGHGPFSHAFEDVMKKLGFGKHETTSVRLIRDSEVAAILDSFAPIFSDAVAQIINNKVPDDIYAAIVASQFDADRLDYMRRDRFMTGAQSSAIDFEWLLVNLDVRRVKIGQDGEEVRDIETLVVGQKAFLAAEAYVLGLFHLYPAVYFHKATRGAEKIFAALLMRIFQLVRDSAAGRTGLPVTHPLIQFPRKPDDLTTFCNLDDAVVLGALPMLGAAKDACIRELSGRLSTRSFYKAVDVTAKLDAAFIALAPDEREERRRKAEAIIRVKLADSRLLEANDTAPRVLEDVVMRDPYRHGQGDGAVLDAIYAVDRTGEVNGPGASF
jgi:HD superfamily phosphohydrolase